MKYKVGDKTLLGEIVTASMCSFPYLVDGRWRFTESEIDKIIIKPKRNIDHLADLWDNGEINKAVEFFNEIILESKIAVIENVFAPYTEQSKYPKLTPEEIKALKLARDCGFNLIQCDGTMWVSPTGKKHSWVGVQWIPSLDGLLRSNWITPEPMSINELLARTRGLNRRRYTSIVKPIKHSAPKNPPTPIAIICLAASETPRSSQTS